MGRKETKKRAHMYVIQAGVMEGRAVAVASI